VDAEDQTQTPPPLGGAVDFGRPPCRPPRQRPRQTLLPDAVGKQSLRRQLRALVQAGAPRRAGSFMRCAARQQRRPASVGVSVFPAEQGPASGSVAVSPQGARRPVHVHRPGNAEAERIFCHCQCVRRRRLLQSKCSWSIDRSSTTCSKTCRAGGSFRAASGVGLVCGIGATGPSASKRSLSSLRAASPEIGCAGPESANAATSMNSQRDDTSERASENLTVLTAACI